MRDGMVALDLGVVSLADRLDDLDDEEQRLELPPAVYLEMDVEEVYLPPYHATDYGWDCWFAEHLGPVVLKFVHPKAKAVRLTIEDLDPDEDGYAGRSADLEVTPLPVRVIQCAS